ncbi:prephenate/arogenate dehydrogenase [Synechococcus sp. PCC 7336]|uniref:prephenate/arogenate dehydrogenase n=1 Tax=Synechococcus sp. PCC 7336 TaxID=195250 RepID=UPI00034DDA4F|nr:prephenate/arogenate dehydrogenase [Synechococcus sp. PCC 7336]
MKIGIVGLGLIGGSLALEFGKQGHELWGSSRSAATCQIAVDRHVVHRASPDLASLAPVDIAFICTPIPYVLPTLKTLAGILRPEAIATDVASVKGAIVTAATELWPNFVGGHPMAGTTQQGIDAAQFDLFAGCTYVITPVKQTQPEAISTLESLMQPLNLTVVTAAPEIHDAAVAWISHLPAMVSAALVTACGTPPPEELQLAQQLASSGFRDTSRVGGGNPELGTAMAQFNREALLRSLYTYRDRLDGLIQLVEAEDWSGLFELFQQARVWRVPFVE